MHYNPPKRFSASTSCLKKRSSLFDGEHDVDSERSNNSSSLSPALPLRLGDWGGVQVSEADLPLG